MTTISEERTKLAGLGQPLRLRSQWGAVRTYADPRPVIEPAAKVFVHITITNPSVYSSNDAHARSVERIGISRFPSTGISYNRGVMIDGNRYEFQPMGRRGAHTGSYSGNCPSQGCPYRGRNVSSANHNVTGRGYVICQNVGDPVSAKQLDALARTIAADQLAGFVVRGAEIHGHRCVSDKSCPGDKMWALMSQLVALVRTYVLNGLGTPPIPPPAPTGDLDMPLLIKKGTSVGILVTGDRAISLPIADAQKIADQAKIPVVSGLSVEAIQTIQTNLLPELEPVEPVPDEPQGPPSP